MIIAVIAKNQSISNIAAHFLSGVRSRKVVVLTCVFTVADITTLFCCWETDKAGGTIVHHSVNKYFEVNRDLGWLVDWHIRSIIWSDICHITYNHPWISGHGHVVTTGIAVALLSEGWTVYSLLKLPVPFLDNSSCNIVKLCCNAS